MLVGLYVYVLGFDIPYMYMYIILIIVISSDHTDLREFSSYDSTWLLWTRSLPSAWATNRLTLLQELNRVIVSSRKHEPKVAF